jgi:hypothetical protein
VFQKAITEARRSQRLSVAEHSGQLLIDVSHLWIEVKVPLSHPVQDEDAFSPFGNAAMFIAALRANIAGL